MRYGKLKAGLAIAGALVGMAGMAAQPAFADYAPTSKDVVGVGSDTLQYLVDFAADGDHLGDPGYNSSGNKFKLISFDATADANARLAYGADGVGDNSATACAPGTGGTAGTGNATAKHKDQPCTLNPTIVLRAGLSPVQRPNGSGAGAKALAADTSAYPHLIMFSRASSCQGPTCTSGGNPAPGPLSAAFDSIQVGNDPLAILKSSTPASNAVPLSAQQLNLIYACTDTTWTQVGGTSTDTIIPIIPQVGSGTRSSFLSAIGNPTLGPCVKTGEENDPTAIAAQTNPADAIEPMSGGRLNLFLGLLSDGTSNGAGSYFRDASCSLNAINTSTPAACAAASNKISPAVTLVTTGTPSDTNALFDITRPLYIYFRDADVTQAAVWQPGGTLNEVRSLLYNPCLTGQTGCVTIGGITYGPGGQPWFATASAATDISASGIVPTYVPQVGGP
jgi:ABC-type phosphate transport system substrate-binding protein